MIICLLKEALRASSVALVQLLAALGIEVGDIAFVFLQLDDSEEAAWAMLLRRVTRSGDALLMRSGLGNHQNRRISTYLLNLCE